jgi:hypothetical protein
VVEERGLEREILRDKEVGKSPEWRRDEAGEEGIEEEEEEKAMNGREGEGN